MDFSLLNFNMLLSLLHILVLLVCLYILRDSVIFIRESVLSHSTSAILYLRSKTFIKGFRIVLLAIIVWSLREMLDFMRNYVDFYSLPAHVAGMEGTVYEAVGLFIAVFLSYGLYIISVSFKAHLSSPEGYGKEPADI